MNPQAWQSARNMLCIRLDHFGDVLMMTPALRALRDSLPGRRIALLAAPHGAGVARFIPEIDDTIEYAAPWMKSSAMHDATSDLDMIGQLRAQHFDAAVIFTSYSQSPLPAALLCTLAGIPLRLAHCRENPYQLLSDWVLDPEPQQRIRHEVQRQLDLVAAVGCHTDNERLSFTPEPTDLERMQALLQRLDIDHERPWLLLHPGATAASRRYPPGRWAQAAAELTQRLHCPLVLTGSAAEQELVGNIMSMIRTHHPGAILHTLAGRLNLGELGAVIAMSSLVLVNNTGPAHLAAALGKPIVNLYALTNPQHTPWRTPSRILFQDVPCRFCYKSICPQGHQHCLTQVSPARIVEAAMALLAHDAGDPGTVFPLVLADSLPA